jgi:tagatose-6-phosphate ketose/aldose isomerase
MDALEALLSLSDAERTARGFQFTASEIAQQPRTWEWTYRRIAAQEHTLRTFLEMCGVGVDGPAAPIVRLIGAGTSDYLGRAVRALLAKRWECEVVAVPSTELLTGQADWTAEGRGYLWIWFSRSGESAESVAGLEMALANYPSIRHLIVTCNQQGLLVRRFARSGRIMPLVLDDVVNDRGLAMTSSFSNMIIAAQMLADLVGPCSYAPVLERLVAAGRAFRPRAADACAVLAAEGYRKMCFLGTGPLNGVAHECSLKVLELTAGRIQTMAHSALGVRHGPLSALDDETLVVAFLSGDSRRRGYETDLLTEIRAKRLARTTVAIAPTTGASDRDLADRVIPLDPSSCPDDDYRPPLDAMFGQLLALFCSIHHGLKPDAPSPNGAISRVVSAVRIH